MFARSSTRIWALRYPEVATATKHSSAIVEYRRSTVTISVLVRVGLMAKMATSPPSQMHAARTWMKIAIEAGSWSAVPPWWP